MEIIETTPLVQIIKVLSNKHRVGRNADLELARRVVNNNVPSVNYYVGEFLDNIVEYIRSSIYNGDDPRTDIYMILSAPINAAGIHGWHKVSLYSANNGCSLHTYTQIISIRETIRLRNKIKKKGVTTELLDYFDYQTLLNMDSPIEVAEEDEELNKQKEYRKEKMRRAIEALKERDQVVLKLLVIEKHSSLDIFDQLIPYIKVKDLNGKTKEEVINSMTDKQKQDKVSVLKTRALAQLVKHYSRIK